MKKLVFSCFVLALMVSSQAIGQEPVAPAPRPEAAENRIPDWQPSYQSETARDYIRKRAQEKTAARQARIEGMKWMGYSPSRPSVSSTPFMSSPPRWVAVSPQAYWGPGFWAARPYSGPVVW